ncbi:hypothetical protein [Virgibacillus doumboii]|uniref:hypothetical protein n=1 Tax=Virgibacillus doumboii TaxID=2697503 RepID=UPI0013DEE0EA|nr:hypothetical protein [Virgibacillus doumboii]
MIAFMPIIMLLLVLGLVFLVIKRTHKKTNRHGYVKKVQLMVASYIVILLISIGVFYLLPKDEYLRAEKDVSTEPFELRQAANVGEIGKLDKYMEETWTFEINRQELNVDVASNGHSPTDFPIFVETVETQQDSIKASFYRTPMIIDGYDFSDRLKPLTISHASGTLTFSLPDPIMVELSLFKQEFPIMQFSGKSIMDSGHHSEQVLYITIPENIELNFTAENRVEYVN